MTDRVVTLTVLLDKDYRSDDAEEIINAIRMIKGVAEVVPIVADSNVYWAKETARFELRQKIFDALK